MKRIQYAFHPVGQGIFSTGTIFKKGKDKSTKSISWIYDCGSSSNYSKTFFKNIINSANNLCEMGGEVDFLVISHFDKDHFNGIQHLASGGIEKIKTIFIPFMPAWQRILTYFSKDEYYNSEYFEFVINPLVKLREYFDKVNIVIVDYSGGQENGHFTFVFGQHNDNTIGTVNKFIIDDFSKSIENTFVLKNKYLIDTQNDEDYDWKFSFYNIPHENLDSFYESNRYDIEELTEKIKQNIADNEKNENTRRNIDTLARIYKKSIGKKSNDTSLVMLVQSAKKYHFHLYEQKINDTFLNPKNAFCRIKDWVFWHRELRCFSHEIKKCQLKCNDLSTTYFHDNFRILFTGDINISSKKRMNHMLDYLKIKNASLTTLQVMHHGSSKYFHASFPQAVDPHYSVFCADPNFKFNHPARDTLLQFIDKNPIIVNDVGVLFIGYGY